MNIRQYEPADLPGMIETWNEVVEAGDAFPQEEPLTPESGAAFFASQTRAGVAVDDDGTVLGLYILHPNNVGRCGHIANASYAVRSLCRGRHLGEKLVLDCLAQAKAHGFGILQFNAVVEGNVHARHLYERLGFKQLGTIPRGFRMKDGTFANICPCRGRGSRCRLGGMKRILIIDGGPRRNMNTAALCDAFAEGARAASPEIEVERVRLYDLPPWKGCVSCLACKLKGRGTGLCALRDGLSDTLRAANEADGLAIASPIYFSEWTAMTRAFLERLVFPWLSYETFSCAAPKKMPLAWIYSMNAPEPMMADIRKHLALLEGAVARGLGDPEPQFVEAHSTVQVKDYARYAMDGLDPAAHLAWRDANWEDDLAKAHAAGRRLAEKALGAKA